MMNSNINKAVSSITKKLSFLVYPFRPNTTNESSLEKQVLFTAMTLMSLVLGVIMNIIWIMYSGKMNIISYIVIVASVVAFIVYFTTRFGFLNFSIIASTVTTQLLVVLGSIHDTLLLPFVVVPLFIVSIFGNFKGFLIIVVTNLGYAVLLPTLIEDLDSETYISFIYFVIISSSLILIGFKYKYDLELDKLRVLTENQERFLTVFKESPIGMALVGPDYNYVDVNEAFARMLGYTEDELIELKFTDITHPDDLEADMVESKKLFSGEISSYSIQKRYLTKAKSSIWTELTARTVVDRGTGNIYGVAMIEDITERRNYVKALEKSQEETRKLVEFFPDGILIHRNQKIVYVNEAGANIFGYESPQELLGLDVFTIIHPDDIKVARKRVNDLNSGKTPPEAELKLLRPDSKTIHVQVKSRIIEYEGNDAIQVAVRDVTTYKDVERGLIKAKQVAEKSQKIKESFIANMSHEIRTPMNAVMGMTHLLKDTKLDDTQESFLEIVNNSAENLLVIINDILDLSKIEAGKIKFSSEKFSINRIARSVVSTVSLDAVKKNLKLTYSVDPSIPSTLIGDPVRLSQILLNLISNAIKFTSKGNVDLNIELVDRSKTASTIRFTVSDTGMGISEKDLKRVFESFTRAEGASGYGGTGLGLTIVKRLVELQNGTIDVESKLGEGTTFFIELDFGKADDVTNKTRKNLEHKAHKGFINKKILIVEDNKINQLILQKLLEKHGVKCEVANDGIEAVELLKEKQFDLVMMDIKMPNLDGFECTKLIRSLNKHKNTPIVGVSAHAMIEEKEKALKVGMNDYITKPIVPRILFEKLEEFLDD